MKNKKGFTLIELLAVIVILAIIALVAIPVILNMIENARKSSAKSAALGYIDAIEYSNGFATLGSEVEGNYQKIETGDVATATQKLGSHLKGKAPASGTVTIDSNGKVTGATLCINGYNVTYENKDATVNGKCNGSNNNNNNQEPEPTTPVATFGGTKVAAGANDTHKGIVYLNPTDLTVECTASNSQIGTGSANASGCMKFYIFDDSDSNYKLILDHNTTAKVAYNTTRPYVAYENASIKNQVETDTTGWVGSPRIITANEVAAITENTGWNSATKTASEWFCLDTKVTDNTNFCHKSQGTSAYKWLFDYTDGCSISGCDTEDSSTLGYWTSSSVYDYSGYAWYVHRNGSLTYYDVDYANNFGVRPVITIPKTSLQ